MIARSSVFSGSPEYRQLRRVVDGAIESTFNDHPDYFRHRTKRRQATIRQSLVKRVVGGIMGYAEQSARGRSGFSPAVETPGPTVAAAAAGEGFAALPGGSGASNSEPPSTPGARQ